MCQVLASWQLSFLGHANSRDDHINWSGETEPVWICTARTSTYPSVIQQTLQDRESVFQVYRGHTPQLAIAPINSTHGRSESLEKCASSFISQSKPNSVGVLNNINSKGILEASTWTVLEIHNHARQHFDFLKQHLVIQLSKLMSDDNPGQNYALSYNLLQPTHLCITAMRCHLPPVYDRSSVVYILPYLCSFISFP